MNGTVPGCVLVTGGAGFVGSNLLRWILEREPTVRVVNLDCLTYASNLDSLQDVVARHGPEGDGRYFFVRGDVRDASLVAAVLSGAWRESAPRLRHRPIPIPDAVLHLAAETHVDRSIDDPALFIDTNVRGTAVIVDAVRRRGATGAPPVRLLHVSTDEIYGSLGAAEEPWSESAPLQPRSPYAASKAGGDLLVSAAARTYGIDAVIARPCNTYGPWQYPEKLIPLVVTRAAVGENVPVYGDGLQTRSWLHVRDHAAALWSLLLRGRPGEAYNIPGSSELPNLELVHAILDRLGDLRHLVCHVRDRAAHDRRYALEGTKIRQDTGWRAAIPLEAGLDETVAWYLNNRDWWGPRRKEAHRIARTIDFQAGR